MLSFIGCNYLVPEFVNQSDLTDLTESQQEIVIKKSYVNSNIGKIIEAPHIFQGKHWPTGCESVSAVMAMKYAGINISVDTFIDKFLDTTNSFPFDPDASFGGNPRSSAGYGCYAPVIKKALDKVLSGTGYYAKMLKNISLEDLCAQYIDNDIPVILWATRDMKTPYISKSWTYKGKKINWVVPQHCLLLVGYDDNYYIFNDPLKIYPQTYHRKPKVEAAYKGLFSQAIVLLKDSTD